MTIEIKVPDIGSEEVEITDILVKVGDEVKAEQSLITVEGDKASMEIPAPQAGIVKEIKISVGDKIRTGKLIMLFDVIDSITSTLLVQEKNKDISFVTVKKEVNMPDIGSEEVEITDILVKVGDEVKAEQSLITVEGDKASMEIPAPFSGTVKEINISIGDKVSTNSSIMFFEVVEDNTVPIDVSTSQNIELTDISIKQQSERHECTTNNTHVHASPLIRRLARKLDINLSKIKGTGHKGRILHEDIYAYIKSVEKHSDLTSVASDYQQVPTNILSWPKVNFSKFGEIKEGIELSRIQKISGANLSRNWMMIPHVTHFDKINITDLEEFRKQQNAEVKKHNLDVKLTLLVFIMKAVATALEQMPRFNSSLAEDSQSLIFKKYINIGIAVDTSDGLVVPVFKDANKKGILELSRELTTICKKARAGKLSAEEMKGGCFTISSIGNLGTTYFTPIVNAPEVAILGVSKSAIEPVWNGKKFIPSLMMPISLSFDHRVIDGADGARFINIIKNMLIDIRRLLM